MDKNTYIKFAKSFNKKEPKIKNAIVAFLSGGALGFLAEALSHFLILDFGIPQDLSYKIVCLLMIFITVAFTSFGFFDDLVNIFKCGLIIPTTGFAHSVSASSIEYKKEGLITGIGANYLKLAGSVILYSIFAAFVLCLIKAVIISA